MSIGPVTKIGASIVQVGGSLLSTLARSFSLIEWDKDAWITSKFTSVTTPVGSISGRDMAALLHSSSTGSGQSISVRWRPRKVVQ